MSGRGRPTRERRLGVSLFCGSGIGDVGFRAAGVEFIAMCEIDPNRSSLASLNFPEVEQFTGDIWKCRERIVEHSTNVLRDELWLITCTAPCQGMSKNGKGTLLRNIRDGKRPKLDPRNRLILPALDVISTLRPWWVVFENVVEMQNTIIEDNHGRMRLILDIIEDTLGDEYVGSAHCIEVADYGVPQRRQRLITAYTRDPIAIDRFRAGIPLIPPATHSKMPCRGQQVWVSIAEAIADFPHLDAVTKQKAEHSELPFHRVPVLEPKKYKWVQHTPPAKSAFDNQCVNPDCGWDGNPKHGASHNADGINQAHKTTPLYCERCGSLLPRPYTMEADGTLRIMSGFTSAYKRMSGDLPAPTLTRNVSYACSDQKLHPTQNRVLSLAEAMRLQTISDYEYKWGPVELSSGRGTKVREVAPDSLIRLVIGESVPPRFLEQLGNWIERLSTADGLDVDICADKSSEQLALWM